MARKGPSGLVRRGVPRFVRPGPGGDGTASRLGRLGQAWDVAGMGRDRFRAGSGSRLGQARQVRRRGQSWSVILARAGKARPVGRSGLGSRWHVGRREHGTGRHVIVSVRGRQGTSPRFRQVGLGKSHARVRVGLSAGPGRVCRTRKVRGGRSARAGWSRLVTSCAGRAGVGCHARGPDLGSAVPGWLVSGGGSRHVPGRVVAWCAGEGSVSPRICAGRARSAGPGAAWKRHGASAAARRLSWARLGQDMARLVGVARTRKARRRGAGYARCVGRRGRDGQDRHVSRGRWGLSVAWPGVGRASQGGLRSAGSVSRSAAPG